MTSRKIAFIVNPSAAIGSSRTEWPWGIWVEPGASAGYGLFHVTVIGDLTLAEVFLNLPNLYNGKLLQLEKVSTVVGKRVQAFSDQRVLLDMDGEQPGQLPVTIDIVPGAALLIAPK